MSVDILFASRTKLEYLMVHSHQHETSLYSNLSRSFVGKEVMKTGSNTGCDMRSAMSPRFYDIQTGTVSSHHLISSTADVTCFWVYRPRRHSRILLSNINQYPLSTVLMSMSVGMRNEKSSLSNAIRSKIYRNPIDT